MSIVNGVQVQWASQPGSTPQLNPASANIDGDDEWAGVRLTLAVDQGETINSATLTVDYLSSPNADGDVIIYGEDVDDSAAFTTSINNVKSRTKTTANLEDTGDGSLSQDFDVRTIVQEIVDRPGWSNGNTLAFLLEGLDPTSGDLPLDGTFALAVDIPGGGGGGGGDETTVLLNSRRLQRNISAAQDVPPEILTW